MPDKNTPSGPFRVKSKSTGDEFTVATVWSNDDQEVIDKPALTADGRHLPAKPNLSSRAVKSGQKAAATKESK